MGPRFMRTSSHRHVVLATARRTRLTDRYPSRRQLHVQLQPYVGMEQLQHDACWWHLAVVLEGEDDDFGT
eukprot:4170452-Alexandrium_andersonii.AAC.1